MGALGNEECVRPTRPTREVQKGRVQDHPRASPARFSVSFGAFEQPVCVKLLSLPSQTALYVQISDNI